MHYLKQVGLIAAGSQPWNRDVCDACSDKFAYCSSLAIYVYKGYKLESILANYQQRIICISWNKNNQDLLASADAGRNLVVWNVFLRKKIYEILLPTSYTPICSIFWKISPETQIAFLCEKDGLHLWNIKSKDISPLKDARGFLSSPCLARCHPENLSKIAIGHVDGSISLFGCGNSVSKNVLAPEFANENEICQVKLLEWDPLSSDYLLVVTQNVIRLIDVNVPVVITIFSPTSSHISCLSWIKTAPGMFCTSELGSQDLKLWNVSQTNYVVSLHTKLKRTSGFHSILFVECTSKFYTDLIGDEAPRKRFSNDKDGLQLPPGKLLCTFSDGGVGFYNLRNKKWDFYKEMGHTETVFDCEFHPENPDLLASAGFDGSVKIWDISDMSVINSAKFGGIIYSISWSPGDMNCLVVAMDKNAIFIWDVKKKAITAKFEDHIGRIYCVAWNRKHPKKIASCGEDGLFIVRMTDKSYMFVKKHPKSVYGCDWSHHDVDSIATGCDDGKVRCFSFVRPNKSICKVLSGHDSRVFNVKWSPILDGILISGSDDKSIKVWDTKKEVCITTLQGHFRPVRGLLWNPEIPHMILSGSWDSLLMIWDITQSSSIETISHHGADVYGLACHPKRPFLLASSSRDSTVRLTNISSLVSHIHVKILLNQPWSQVIPAPSDILSVTNSPQLLSGKCSYNFLQNFTNGTHKDAVRYFCSFFGNANGCENLLNLVDVHCGKDISLLPSSYKKGFVHYKHLLDFKASQALEAECTGMLNNHGEPAGISMPKLEKLRHAAQLYLKIGNLEKYCEIMAGLNEWDKALAIAPAVSIEFWRSIMRRKCNNIGGIENIDDDCLPYFFSLDKFTDIIDFFKYHGNYVDAQAYTALVIHQSVETKPSYTIRREFTTGACDANKLFRTITNNMADVFFNDGSPIQAACCHMTADDHELAVSKLIRGGEYELAIGVGIILGNVPFLVSEAAKWMARRFEKLGKWDLAVEVVQKFVCDQKSLLLGQTCCRFVGNADETNALKIKAGFLSTEESLKRAEEIMEKNEDVFNAVLHYLLSENPVKGLSIGIQEVTKIMSKCFFEVDEVHDLIAIMSSLSHEKLLKSTDLMFPLMAMSGYVGGLLAIRNGYNAIVEPLFQWAVSHLRNLNLNIGIKKDDIIEELNTWQSFGSVKEGYEKSYETLMKKVGKRQFKNNVLEIGDDFLTGSHLPTHSAAVISCVSTEVIQGQPFFLEDRKSAMWINEAVMWSKVNQFSPLSTGSHINPF